MRINEDAIWTAYIDSKNLVTEKKGLPPWLKKKGDKGEKEDKEEKVDKKEKKGKKGKGLPPWLKKRGKKTVKESMEGNDMGDDVTVTFTSQEISVLSDILSDEMGRVSEDPETMDIEILNQIYNKLTGSDTDDSSDPGDPDDKFTYDEGPYDMGSDTPSTDNNPPVGTEKYLP